MMSDDTHLETDDPEVAREQIVRTRERMSSTLDEIELAIAGKKKRIQDQFDVGSRIRQKPLHAAGAALAGGLLLGFLTGGRKGGDDAALGIAATRGAVWERRARRLLEIARSQEEEVARLRSLRSFAPGAWRETELDRDELLEADDPDAVEDEFEDEFEDVDGRWADDFEADDFDEDEFDGEPEEESSRLSELKDATAIRLRELVGEATRSFLEAYRSHR